MKSPIVSCSFSAGMTIENSGLGDVVARDQELELRILLRQRRGSNRGAAPTGNAPSFSCLRLTTQGRKVADSRSESKGEAGSAVLSRNPRGNSVPALSRESRLAPAPSHFGSRRTTMAIFIDSSDPKEIKDLFAWGVLSGVTTNPLIIAKEAPDAVLSERIREVLAVSWGDVSVELTTETEKEMLEEARRLPRLGSEPDHDQGPLQRDRPPRPAPAREEGGEDERDVSDGDEPGLPGRARRRDVREHLLRPRARHGLRRSPGHHEHAQHPRPRGARSRRSSSARCAT